MPFGLDDIIGNVGDIAGYFGGQDDRDAANRSIQDSINEYKKLNPTITAQETGPSAYTTLDPATRAAQMDTIARLRSQIASGGMDAIDRSRVNDITNATAQAGRVAGAGAMQDAARRGQGNGTAALISGQVAGQQAAQAGQQAGTQVAALSEQQRQQEIAQEGAQAGQARSQDQTGAGGQDALARFNASQRQGAEESSFNNAATRAGGIAGANKQNYDAQEADAQRLQRLGKGIGTTAGGVANFFVP